MDKRTFFIVTVFMISTVCLTNIEDFDCSGKEYNIALVYDCRYSLQLQQDFFKQFLNSFKPFQFYINVILMTYGRSNLLTLNKLTREHMTWKKFEEATLQVNTSSCPQHLPLKTLFNFTRDALSGVSKTVIKLAIFVLSENLTEFENVTVLHELESEKGLNVDVKRLFILAKPPVELEVNNRTLLYTSSLTNKKAIVKTIIQHICNSCSEDDHDMIKLDGNCYRALPFQKELRSWEAPLLCWEHFPYTDLVSFSSKWEYEQFISRWNILLENITHDCRKVVMLYDDDIDCNTTLVKGKQEITFDAFIGLTGWVSSTSKFYKWNDENPLVFDPPWGSRIEGESCVYMSQKYYYTGDKLTRGKLVWNEMDCGKRKRRGFVICESQRTVVKELSLNFNDFKPKKLEYKVHLLYTSYSHLLFYLINNQFENVIDALIGQIMSVNFIQKECINICQKYKESNETYMSKDIETTSEMVISIPSRSYSCEINQIDSPMLPLKSYNRMCRIFRETERKMKLLNSSRFTNTYLRYPDRAVVKCLYEIVNAEGRYVPPGTTHLQDCEQFLCPLGFIKCPDSYCIPVYLVDDVTKHCPHGEDEGFITYQTKLCDAKLKLTLRNICLQQEMCEANGQCINTTNDFVCHVPCDTGYVCLSRTM